MLLPALLPCLAAAGDPAYVLEHGDLVYVGATLVAPPGSPPDDPRCRGLPLPADWDVRRALPWTEAEGVCLVLLWRPWKDLPTARWSSAPSPITDLHDVWGASAHVALMAEASAGYREVWVSSGLPRPGLDALILDVDGDGARELALLEGTYAAGRDGPATSLSVWRWNGFGFTLDARAAVPAGRRLALGRRGEREVAVVTGTP